ncbi:MAG: serine hydrolase domain-containing protein [Candidatus Saccharibacteria bacterium]|nr:serine hydrolase domain-containing protein [Candidatus Saccharibacteria bacterium]
MKDTHFLRHPAIHDGTLLVQQGDTVCIDESKGEMTSDSLFAITSISKLYTYALVFRLIDEGKLRYDARLTELLPQTITGILPQADAVTIRHLVDQNSGFPNYETDRQPDGSVLMDEVLHSDRRVEFHESLEILSKLPARSQLGGEKAYYADVNAMLLGKIAEAVTGKTAEQLLSDCICQPLGLRHTHWARGDEVIAPIRNGKTVVSCSHYLSSQVYQGGIVATNRELMRFTRAFFGGELFVKSHIMQPVFRPIQFRPLRYGSGMMQLKIAAPVALFFGGIRELRGHSGITGSFAFYAPDVDAFVTGTVNQLRHRPYPMLFGALKHCRASRPADR